MSDVTPEILDKLTKVCICKVITRDKIKKVIQKGNLTVEAVNKETGSGSGACGGKRCGPKIQELIEIFKAENENKSS